MNKKIIAAIAIVVIVVISTVGAAIVMNPTWFSGPPTTPTVNLPPMTLTVVGVAGEEVVLNETSMADLPAIESYGGYKTSGGLIAVVGNFTGVSALSLCDLVGGMPSDATLTITASDGYSMVFTNDQVHGEDFTTYDQVTGSEKAATQPLTLVVNYFHNSTELPSDVGPLRMGIVGSEGLLTEGHFWVKMVSKLEVTPNTRDWRILVNATTWNDYMDRQDFTADLNHFGINYTDTSGNVWTGTALWRWVSWANYNGGPSNSSLDAGYSVKIISGDGTSAVFDDSEVKNNDNIIVAAKLNGAILPDPYWPLTMVGSGVPSSKQIKNIVQIQIILDQEQEEEEPTPVQEWTLTVNGTTAVSMSRTAFEGQVSQVSMTWKDSSNNNWTGTPLHRLVVWGTSNGAISSDALTSGYVVKIIASDGYTIVMNDSRIDMNTNIFAANTKNGAVLTGGDWPLTLAGSGISSSEMVEGIVQIQIMPFLRMNLTVVGNGQEKILFSNDIAALSPYSGLGGTRSNSGSLANFGTYTGVPMLTLCNLVGGITSTNTVRVTASDGFTSTLTYAQVNGQGITTYNSTGSQVTPTQPLTMIVAYYLNGTSIPVDPGPLRVMTIGPEGLYTPGSLSARQVIKVEIL